jgi:hypothetical protein
MTIATVTEWEIRTTGSSTNGGGFKDLNPGTSVDYSQQNSAQLALTDIASNGVGTGISSTTGGFTAAMEGNCMYITGTGFTTGWYQITGYTDTNNITIDRSCGASASGGTGNVGGAWLFNSTNFATFFNTTNKGTYNKCHIEAGTYSGSFGSGVLTVAALYLKWLGYNTTRNDLPQGTNRPLLTLGSGGAYINWTGADGHLRHCRIDSTYASSQFAVGGTSTSLILRNCKITRSGSTGCTGVQLSSFGVLIQCEIVATSGVAVRGSNSSQLMLQFCYIHDSATGYTYSGSVAGFRIDSCVFDTCSTVAVQVFNVNSVTNCTIYNCGTGIQSIADHLRVYNCIIHTCTTGINASAKSYADNNILYNCTTPRTGGIEAGPNSLTSDPKLADPANQDFTLDPGSPAFNAGIKLGAAVGL